MRSAVLDASVAIDIAAERVSGSDELADIQLYAPHLIDLEFAQSMRSLVLRKQLSLESATDALITWATGHVIRCEHASLLPRVWQLRHSITAYDASYVALAEQLEVPLLTSDRRLAASADRYCEVILVGG